MKQKHNLQPNIENPETKELFAVSQKTGLTASEQAEMWSGLKEYANYHTKPTATKQSDSLGMLSYVRHWYTAVAAMFLLVAGTGFTSTNSLPGEFLYPIKVQVTEPFLGSFQFGDAKQLEYLGTVIDNRLSEMKELQKIQKLTESEMVILEDKITEHSEDIIEILTETESNENNVDAKESVILLSEIVSDIRTQEYIEDIAVGVTRKSKIEEVEKTISQLYVDELSDFSSEEPAEANLYIEDILDEIDAYVTESDQTLDSGIEIRDYLVDAAEALENNNLEQALFYSSEAQQSMDLSTQIESLEETSEPTE